LRLPIRTAIMAAMILAQVGEFSFLLISLGVDYDVISSTDFQNMLVAIIVTMIVTPTLVTIAPFVAERVVPLANAIPALRRWSMDDERGMIKLETADEERDKPMVVIIGGGVLGTHVAHVFKQTGITYRMVELNRDTVARLRERGEPVLAGDITDVDTLEHAGVRDAAVVIVAINNTMALVRGVEVIRHMRPDVQIIVRSRYLQDCGAVREKGADLVIVEEFESSISVFTHVLAYLGAAPELIEQQEQRMRAQRGLIV
jgi:CPA2 family monovalent cation:H+ antiporter-2